MKRIGQGSSRRGVLLLSVSFLSGIALLMATQGLADDFLSHPVFVVREIEVQWPRGIPARSPRFRLNPPTSIFRVDLKALSTNFQRRFPAVEVESIRRLLPNRLVATMRLRKVVGQVNLAKAYAPVSDDGILIGPGLAAPRPNLPILILSGLKGPLRVGRSLDCPSFWKASELLATLHRDGGIAGHRVMSVRVEGEELFLLLDSGTEIRFAGTHLAVAWQQLAGVVNRRPDVLNQAGYIDLRFGDPVIGEKPKEKSKHEKRTTHRRS